MPGVPRKLSEIIRSKGKKALNNAAAALPAKVDIRQRILTAIGAPQASVFDGYAGNGELYRRVWRDAARYTGCDVTWYRDERLLYVVDNRRLMRNLDLQQFNIFDFDPYGSPWDNALILAVRRKVAPGERLGLVLTDGSSLRIKFGSLPHSLATLAGVTPDIAGATAGFDILINRAISETARRLQCRIVHRWEARGRSRSRMVYIGLLLEGTG